MANSYADIQSSGCTQPLKQQGQRPHKNSSTLVQQMSVSTPAKVHSKPTRCVQHILLEPLDNYRFATVLQWQ